MPLPEEQNDPAWELLKRARRTEPSPFFSRNVVREIRKREDEGGSWRLLRAWISGRGRPILAGAVATVVLVVSVAVLMPGGPDSPDPVAASPVPTTPPASGAETEFDPATEVGNLEYLGQLMAVTDPAALDDAALADLLF